MRKAIPLLALVLTAACGTYHFPGESPSPSPSTGTVAGRIVAVPCAPIEQPGRPCAGRPVAGLEVDYLGQHADVFKTVTDSTGAYSIAVPAGSYKVTLKTYMRVLSGPLAITVAAGSATIANYTLDSGIRVPAPATAPG